MLDVALRRAALRAPGRAATASLASFRALRARLAAAPLPEPAPIPGPVRVRTGEQWCSKCGNDGNEGASRSNTATRAMTVARCSRCGSTSLVPVADVLNAGEYIQA